MFKRNIKPLLEKALKRSPVVLLNGARQVGKTTLAREFMKDSSYHYVTLDDEITYLAAKGDTTGFLTALPKPVILDEVQRVPEIFLTLKRDVDSNRIAGRYLLTGSANPLLIPRLGDSLAGRMEIIDLMPLSQGEIHQKKDTFIDVLFSEKQLQSPPTPLSKEDLYERIIRGGYPSVQNGDSESRDAWMRSYLNLILQKDIRDLAQIEKVTELPNLLRITATRAANLLNVAHISSDIKMIAKTVHRYLALLETIFIIYRQLPWSNSRSMRLIKSPKLYLVDSGLLCYLLNVSLERLLADGLFVGSILENFIVGELRKQATWSATQVQSYHFRTVTGEEVDVVLEDRSGAIVGIEIKHGFNVTKDDFKGLRYLKNKVGKKFLKGIVLYTGSQYIPFSKDLFAMPINSVWETVS